MDGHGRTRTVIHPGIELRDSGAGDSCGDHNLHFFEDHCPASITWSERPGRHDVQDDEHLHAIPDGLVGVVSAIRFSTLLCGYEPGPDRSVRHCR